MVSRIRDRIFSFIERNSRVGLEPFGLGTRLAVLALMLSFVGLGALGFSALVNPAQFVDPSGLDLSGKWNFFNGSLKVAPIQVDVPKPLAPQLKQKLAEEYFYRRGFLVPTPLLNSTEDLSITLGSIKGRFSIWINGNHLATSAANSDLANYVVPREFVSLGKMDVLVRVQRTDTLFPGIVHFVPMQLGRTAFLSRQIGHRFFQLAVKPIVPALFKGMIFLIFATLFFTMAARREYFWFSFYALTSALGAFSFWQYSPFFENYFLRQKIIFFLYSANLFCLPLLTVEFCRLGSHMRSLVACCSGALMAIPVLSLLWLSEPSSQGYLFQFVYKYLPVVVFPPCIALVFSCVWFLRSKTELKHRMWQLGVFGAFLCAGLVIQSGWAEAIVRFQHFYFVEILDIGVFVGLALSMVFDFKVTSLQWQRSQKSLPTTVARLAAVGVHKAVVDFQAVVLVIDVVGYTKRLLQLSGADRDFYNSEIKRVASEIVSESGGEKVSDTGDGAVFVWSFETEEEMICCRKSAVDAAVQLGKNTAGGIVFRCGISEGQIKCHWDEPEFSYLGDPINTAARLQSVAEPGGLLVDEKISFSGDVSEFQIKGARFRARSLKQYGEKAA